MQEKALKMRIQYLYIYFCMKLYNKIMMKYFTRNSKLFLIGLCLISVTSLRSLRSQSFEEDLRYLASDELQGRKPGTQGGLDAAKYIKKQFKSIGLHLLGEEGFQSFEIVTEVKAGKKNSLIIKDFNASLHTDFSPYSFTANSTVEAEVVFAGYGFDINDDSITWNDYSGIDVRGKWVLILRGDPEPDNSESKYIEYSEERNKVLTAKDKGAAGVLFVSGAELDKKDELVSLYFDKSQAGSGIPVIHIKRSLADKILDIKGASIELLEKELNSTIKPNSFAIPVKIKATTDIIHTRVTTQNVIAMLEGSDPVLKNEYIIIGGHYDHLGMGGPGSGSREPDTIAVHHGADDNASGIAGIIDIARKISSDKSKIKRTIIFIAFGAEEMGLLGSKHFVKTPLIDLKKVRVMINIDMIGRLKEDTRSLLIGGTGTFKEAEEILNKYSKDKFKLSLSPEGFGPSDHASFYTENIPVIFVSTGAHDDYHKPADDVDKINFEGGTEVISFLQSILIDIASTDSPMMFQQGSTKSRKRSGGRFKVTLGIMPGFGDTENNGLRVDGVSNGGPAEKGGMKKGDLIVAIDGKKITNIYDYMFRLKKLEPGQIVTVDVIRGEDNIVLIVAL